MIPSYTKLWLRYRFLILAWRTRFFFRDCWPGLVLWSSFAACILLWSYTIERWIAPWLVTFLSSL